VGALEGAGGDALGPPVRRDPLISAADLDDEPDAREALAQILGHAFADRALLLSALTHPSVGPAEVRRRSRSAGGGAYERLEFLGDRVLGLVVAHMLYESFRGEDEGALAKRLASLVRRETVARVAETIDLGPHLILSRGEADSGGRSSRTLLADALEALIGALYLDAGLVAAEAFIRRNWAPLLEADTQPPQDAKTALQEWAQGAGLPLPDYVTVGSEGPPHSPVFSVEVQVEGHPPARGSGRSKRAAEQAAAEALLEAIRAPSERGPRPSTGSG
jgi:ribonuclease III